MAWGKWSDRADSSPDTTMGAYEERIGRPSCRYDVELAHALWVLMWLVKHLYYLGKVQRVLFYTPNLS